MAMTNTDKRRQETELIHELNPRLKAEVFANKKNFYDADGTNLSDHYELIVKTTDSQVRGLKGRDAMEQHEIENGRFVFAFFESAKLLQERFETLTPQDIARLMFIGTYVGWETGRLQSDNGKKAYKKKDVRELVGMSPQKFNELFKRYIAEGVITEVEDGQLFVNPTVIYRGSIKKLGAAVSDLQHTRVFRKTVRELYVQFNGRKLGQLALVYSVIPYLNFDSNIVCHNPEETATDLVKPINLTELSELLSPKDDDKKRSPSKLKTALNAVKVDGVPMFTYVEDPHNRREKRIIVNPRIIFAGNGESLESIMKLFN